jgi:hypothetical protein
VLWASIEGFSFHCLLKMFNLFNRSHMRLIGRTGAIGALHNGLFLRLHLLNSRIRRTRLAETDGFAELALKFASDGKVLKNDDDNVMKNCLIFICSSRTDTKMASS